MTGSENSWIWVIERVAARFPDCKSCAAGLRLDWEPAEPAAIESQSIVMLPAAVAGIDVVMLLGWIGADSGLDAREMLSYSGWRLGGGVISRDDAYLFRMVLPLASLDGDQLDAAIDYVASESLALRERSLPPVVGAADFSWAL